MTNRKFTHPDDAPEGHEWETVNGDPVEIWATDGGTKNELIQGRLKDKNIWEIAAWNKYGNHAYEAFNLRDKPQEKTVWLYKNNDGVFEEGHPLLPESARNTVIKVTYVEGQRDDLL